MGEDTAQEILTRVIDEVERLRELSLEVQIFQSEWLGVLADLRQLSGKLNESTVQAGTA